VVNESNVLTLSKPLVNCSIMNKDMVVAFKCRLLKALIINQTAGANISSGPSDSHNAVQLPGLTPHKLGLKPEAWRGYSKNRERERDAKKASGQHDV